MKFYRYNTEDAFKWVDLLWIRFFIDRKLSFCVWNSPSSLLFSVWWFLDSERILRLLLLPFFSSSTTHTDLTTANILFFQPAKATSALLQQTFELSDLNSLAKQKLRVVLFKWRFIFLHFFLLFFSFFSSSYTTSHLCHCFILRSNVVSHFSPVNLFSSIERNTEDSRKRRTRKSSKNPTIWVRRFTEKLISFVFYLSFRPISTHSLLVSLRSLSHQFQCRKSREWWSSKKKFHWDYFALRLLNTEILWIVISRRSHRPKLCGTYTHSRQPLCR